MSSKQQYLSDGIKNSDKNCEVQKGKLTETKVNQPKYNFVQIFKNSDQNIFWFMLKCESNKFYKQKIANPKLFSSVEKIHFESFVFVVVLFRARKASKQA